MMISDEQRNSIKEWLAAGDSLADVQKKLKEKYDLTMTYMDVRLLVLEIGAEVQDEPEPEPEKEKSDTEESAPAGKDSQTEDDADSEGDENGAGAGTGVSVSIDQIVVPGAVVSGEVTFSDGVKSRWMLDRMGRFGLEPEKEGYQPSEMDLQMLQVELSAELQRKGYA
ncbi:MAG: hypothetical protein R6V06_10310 [Kiritimatiellia bacterium]